jgi:dTDP-4-dehydrorhamnose reductase
MLGSLVRQHLERKGYAVLTTDRRYTGDPADDLIREVASSSTDVVVNCVGITTARNVRDLSLFVANALLPVHLAAALGGRLLVHASTDCVFRGDRGAYDVAEPPDANDPYGLSKRLGEGCVREGNVIVLRTSIVGPEARSARGLLAWFLATPGPVEGWTDHRWNGITTLAWARLCEGIVAGTSALGPGLHQPCTADSVSKFELLELFAEIFDHRVEIRPIQTEVPRDRTLRPTVPMAPLRSQLIELRDWIDASLA